MIPRSWGGRSTRRKESRRRSRLFHLSKFPSTSAKWNIDTCIEPREDRISDDDKKRRERKEIFYIWRTLYTGYMYGGSRTMITRRRTLDDRDCSISRVNRSGPVFRLNSPREMENRSFVRSLSRALWFSLAGCETSFDDHVNVWLVDLFYFFDRNRASKSLYPRCYDESKLFDYGQIGRDDRRKLHLDSILLELCSTTSHDLRYCRDYLRIVREKYWKNITYLIVEKLFIKVTEYFLDIFFPFLLFKRETLEYIIRLFFRCNVTGNISSLLTDILFRVAVTDHKVKEWHVNNDVQLARDLHRIRERRLRPWANWRTHWKRAICKWIRFR